MKHALQYNFIALFMQRWITAYYSCIANSILLDKLQASASTSVGEEICSDGARWARNEVKWYTEYTAWTVLQ